MKLMKRMTACVLAAFLLFTTGITAFAAKTPGEIASLYIRTIIDTIEEDYRFDADKEAMYNAVLDCIMKEHPELLEDAIRAVMDTLDPHSEYFTQEELVAFVDSVQASYVGIGVTIQLRADGVEIIEVAPTGGAQKAGIQAGDLLIAVDGVNIVGMSLNEVTKKVQGEVDTNVTLTLLRDGEAYTVTVTRSRINNETVAYSIEEGNIGYIRIVEFAPSTPQSMKKALDAFKAKGITKMILDVRDNPGGTLGSAIGVLSLFVPKNMTIAKMEYNDPNRSFEVSSEATFASRPNRKIIVLANKNSASASEMFAGALQNLGFATVVGETTFGKGSMQEFMGLNNPAGFQLGDIKLSVAEFTKPDGGKINGVGIEPNVRVKNTLEPYDVSQLTPMTISGKYAVGDQHSDVCAIEERLSILGYFNEEPDEVFTESTKAATEAFQDKAGLCAYGVMDFTTQSALNDRIAEVEVEVDRQFMKACELLKQ